ncbi:membrane protein [Mycobacterium phage Yecey3]|uniref:Membrane protein n=1 Tax=Mycobacterium phage Yecey3 TaxID=2656617 RepID=A0A649V8Z0_9CAUD|nr:membrane protein [Mycobacterium phage Yecey3]QGJ88821.1 membrane protein [Mycobacterium phage Yecey3]
MKKLLLALILPLIIVGLTACEDLDQPVPYDPNPHGFIYVPPMGKSPGVGPIFY